MENPKICLAFFAVFLILINYRLASLLSKKERGKREMEPPPLKRTDSQNKQLGIRSVQSDGKETEAIPKTPKPRSLEK
jgi:hypothetical protein